MLSKIKKFWRQYGFEIVLILSLFIMLCVYIFGNKKGTWSRYVLTKEPHSIQRQSKDSKGEIECRRVLERLFNKPFNKARPDILRNPITGSHNLELDCYNEELKLACEYNGIQHYEYTPYFHRTKDAFHNQKYRDHIKREACEKAGIKLIEVPYTVKIFEIENFIKNKLNKWNQI